MVTLLPFFYPIQARCPRPNLSNFYGNLLCPLQELFGGKCQKTNLNAYQTYTDCTPKAEE